MQRLCTPVIVDSGQQGREGGKKKKEKKKRERKKKFRQGFSVVTGQLDIGLMMEKKFPDSKVELHGPNFLKRAFSTPCWTLFPPIWQSGW